MTAFYFSAAVVLLLTIVLGLGHVFRQPGRAESLLAALLFGSTGVALSLDRCPSGNRCAPGGRGIKLAFLAGGRGVVAAVDRFAPVLAGDNRNLNSKAMQHAPHARSRRPLGAALEGATLPILGASVAGVVLVEFQKWIVNWRNDSHERPH